MIPDARKASIATHQRWLGHLQPEGLVVSPLALVDSQVVVDEGGLAAARERFLDALDDMDGRPVIGDFPRFARQFLGWRDDLLSIFSVSAEVPDGLRISTGDDGEVLEPSAAYRYFKPSDLAKPWMLLVKVLHVGEALDELPDAKSHRGWVATPHQKFERLLRESGVPVGLLCNGDALRLVYAPKGENSGWITFPVAFLGEMAGRLAVGGLDLLLSHQRLILVPEPVRLSALLRKSRDYQAHVSTELAGQVLESLYELARGFQAADEKSGGTLLASAWDRDPQEIYGGFISTLLRLVFLLYAEDRGLMPAGPLYQRNYSVAGLFEQLRTDHEQYPDTMDHRFGGWPRLLSLFRAVHGGCRHRSMSLPARRGHLFDPERFPFLEGRPDASAPLPQQLPRISDGTLHRVLDLLLYLDGERLSYRTLDVEQIGSVYETIMGFEVQKATGRSVALKPKKSHGAPVHLDLDALLASKPADREKTLADEADTKLPEAAAKALKSAATADDLLAALDKRIDRRATPHPVPAGSIILQPTDERRRSGSHYTPRSFTEPIVRKTLEPILDHLGRHPRPEVLLELKIADIAVGSAAFLVETCRQLADELAAAWHFHKCLPVIPPDEDELLYARRLVAQRCLYGVDRNPMAVDLAKLSLWLATMAKDHPFTFVDHAIKCGDSLVGLTNKQIAAFHWDPTQAADRVLGQDKLEKQIERVAAERKRILDFHEDNEAAVLKKRDFLAAADQAAASLKSTGDLAIAAFFAGDKPKQRQQFRDEFLRRHLEWRNGADVAENLAWEVKTLKELRGGDHPIRPFHWEIEFPEVFSRENPGFDAIVGNPPFLGGKRIKTACGENFRDWLPTLHEHASSNADLVAQFFRRAFTLSRELGTFGLIATNTITQGDTRSSGLKIICKGGGSIYAATRRAKWPGEAAVMVSVIHIIKADTYDSPTIDGKLTPAITAYLFDKGNNEDPAVLTSNLNHSFIGSYILGVGFTFDDTSLDKGASPVALIKNLNACDQRNSERIFPFLGGSEINDSPTHSHSRYVINFFDFPLRREDLGFTWKSASESKKAELRRTGIVPLDYPEPVAADWPDLLDIVTARVRPERTRKNKDGIFVLRSPLPQRWWMFADKRPALYSELEPLEYAFALCQTSKYLGVVRLSPRQVFSHKVVVFPESSFSLFALLQSQQHIFWADFFGSTLEDRPVYTPSDCFETFPFPPDWENTPALEESGRAYYEFRAALMIRNDEGLTKTYNRFHDPEERSPDIAELRRLHAAMDRAVLDAYGWADIPTACEFLLDYEEDDEDESAGKKRKKKKPYRFRWPDETRDEVLARLLALNAERHAEEVAASLASKPKTPKKPRKQKPTIMPTSVAERKLPADMRFSSPSPGLYAVHLITALLSTRPEGLSLRTLRDAFVAVTRPSILLDLALPEDKSRVSEWARIWKEAATPADFIPALNSMGSANLAIEGEGLDAVIALQDGPQDAPTDFVAYDAWLALRVIEPLSASSIPLDADEPSDAAIVEWLQTV